MSSISFLTKGFKAAAIEQRLVQKLLYFNTSKFIQELMYLGFEYSFQIPIVLNLESAKGHFYTAPLLRVNELNKLNYLIKEVSIDYNTKLTYKYSYKAFLNLLNSFKYLNPFSSSIHIMSNTGAKANWNQICQLIGIRGYLSNAQGDLFKLPILNNFTKSLQLYEYFISCFGARKGILDTAIKTADAGYLTRRLVESAQESVIKEYSCGSNNYVTYNTMYMDCKGSLKPTLYLLLHGKSIADHIKDPKTKKIIEFKHNYITSEGIKNIPTSTTISTYSIKTCLLSRSFCSMCFGFTTFKQNSIGKSVGIIAGQSIGEPGTQLTLRTFHTGGVSQLKSTNKYSTSDDLIKKLKIYHKQFKYKLCSNTYVHKTLTYKTVSSNTLYLKGMAPKVYTIINSFNRLKLLVSSDLLILFKNSRYIYNYIWSQLYINTVYQRNKDKHKTLVHICSGENIFKQNIQLLVQNKFKVWELFNLRKAVLFNKYYYIFNLKEKYNLLYTYSKNNHIIRIYIINKSLNNLFSFKLYTNYLDYFNVMYIYTLIFTKNYYSMGLTNIIQSKTVTYKKQIQIFKTNILKFNNILYN